MKNKFSERLNIEINQIEPDVYIQFKLTNKLYATKLLNIKEVLPLPELTPIPKTPSYFKGLMNLRGHVISVIDIKEKMKIPKEKNISNNSSDSRFDFVENSEVVMVVGTNDFKIGVIVDHVTKVLMVDSNEIASADIEDQLNKNYVEGLYKFEDSITTFINIFKLIEVDIIRHKNSVA